jgi:CheY-like chemotaxis protein
MNTPWGLEAEIVADASTRQVVLIVEDEALVRMTAVDMIEEAGFEILEASNADEAILLLEARRDITVLFTDIEMPGSMDGLRLAQAVRGRWPPIKIIATSDVASHVTVICHPAGCFYQNPTVLPRFPAPYGSSRPRPKQEAFPKLPRKKSASLLKPEALFLVFGMPRLAVRAPFGGLAETGAGGVRRLLVPILLNGGFGYENYLRFCPPLAVDHRL